MCKFDPALCMRIACGAHAQYLTDVRVSVGTQSESGVCEQNVALFQSFSPAHSESVMELLGPLPRCDL